ncbi:MAG: response regulator transcription factor [Duncaniella sp.]|nr:response regulator transcription factor [Duncaniella sp.]
MSQELKSKVIIIDDDPRSVARLTEMLHAYNDLEISGTAGNATEGRRLIDDFSPSLVFIDIDLPDSNGLVLSREVASLDNPPYVVMYTAFYDTYARDGRAFRSGESDYLLKPVDLCELDKTIQRYRCSRNPVRHEAAPRPMAASSGDTFDRIIVAMTKVTSEIRVLHISDIGYFCYNSQRKVWEAVTRDNTVVSLRKTTSASDILNYSPRLVQTHQSYIVNLDYVMLIGKSHVNLAPPFHEADVLVGRIYFKSLQSRFTFL